ncbi:MAG: glycosyltransferase [Candidatus Hodarchaeota archaeon]
MDKVTVGICAYNEENNIGGLLDNLLTKQELPQGSKVVVVCSGCTDSTPEIVKSFHEKDRRVRLILEDGRKGKAHALNILFERARRVADILVLVNADALPKIGSIKKLLEPFRNRNVGATAGRPMPINTLQGLPNSLVHTIWDLHHRISLYKEVKLSGELCAIRPCLVEKIPIDLAVDEPYIEMLIRNQGYEIMYVPESIVYILGPTSFQELLKQRRRIWVGNLQMKKTTGFNPSTTNTRNVLLSAVMEKSGLNVTKLLEILYFMLTAVEEICAYLGARWDFSKGSIPYTWEPIKSTKRLINARV